jgi:hypothetical protein
LGLCQTVVDVRVVVDRGCRVVLGIGGHGKGGERQAGEKRAVRGREAQFVATRRCAPVFKLFATRRRLNAARVLEISAQPKSHGHKDRSPRCRGQLAIAPADLLGLQVSRGTIRASRKVSSVIVARSHPGAYNSTKKESSRRLQ